VRNWVEISDDEEEENFLTKLSEELHDYKGFNLFIGRISKEGTLVNSRKNPSKKDSNNTKIPLSVPVNSKKSSQVLYYSNHSKSPEKLPVYCGKQNEVYG